MIDAVSLRQVCFLRVIPIIIVSDPDFCPENESNFESVTEK